MRKSPALVLESLCLGCEWRGPSHLSNHLFRNTKLVPISPLHSCWWPCGAGREPGVLAREMGTGRSAGLGGLRWLWSGNQGLLMCETTGRGQELGCRSGQPGNWVAVGRQAQELGLRCSKASAASQDNPIAAPGQVWAWCKRVCSFAGIWGLCDLPLLGICVQPAGFQPYIPVHVLWGPAPSLSVQCLHASYLLWLQTFAFKTW